MTDNTIPISLAPIVRLTKDAVAALRELQTTSLPGRDLEMLPDITIEKATTIAEALATAEEAADAAQKALENERAINADLARRLKNTRNNMLTQAHIKRRLAADLDDARTNVKDQAKRIIAMLSQLASANDRADRADRLADDLAGALDMVQAEIHQLRKTRIAGWKAERIPPTPEQSITKS